MPSRAKRSGREPARDFLDRIREVYGLVTYAKLGVERPGMDRLIVGHRMAWPSFRGQPAPLSNGMYLNVEVALRLGREPLRPETTATTHQRRRGAGAPAPRGPQRLETTQATFTYQAGADNDDPRPVFAYHFDQNSRSGYPSCHLHVHATPEHYKPADGDTRRKSFSRLHLPTRRLTLEQIVWHLIQEHGVKPHRADWREVLWQNETWFRDIQRDKDWPYDPPFDPTADIRRVRGAAAPTG